MKKAAQTSLTPLKGHRFKVFLAPCLKLFECVTELASPFLVRYIIDEGIAKDDWDKTWKYGLLLFLFAFLGFLVTILAQYLAASVASKYSYGLRKSLFDKAESLGEREISSFGKERVLNLIGSDSYAMQSGVMMFMRLIFRPPFLLVGSTVISFLLDWRAGLVFLGAVLLSAGVLALAMFLSPKRYARVQSDLDSLSVIGNDSLSGARPIRAFNKQKAEEAKFAKANDSYEKNTISLAKLNAFVNPLTFFFINAGLILVVWLGVFGMAEGSITTGTVVSLVSYLVSALAALVMFSRLILSLNKAAASKKRIDAFLALEPGIKEGTVEVMPDAPRDGPLIRFEDVSFTYGEANDKLAVRNLSFEVLTGASIGLIGGTGSGKSTAMSLLTRLYDPTSGTILYAGKPLSEYTDAALRREMTFLSQRPSLFKGTIRSNLLLGKGDASEAELWKSLENACAKEFVSSFPEGLDHPVLEGGSNLSGGQRQRLLLARSFLRPSRLLIIDDGLSALDYLSEQKIRNYLKTRVDLTKIIVSQRVSTIRGCDAILVFENGEIVARGTDGELRSSSPLYREFASAAEETR